MLKRSHPLLIYRRVKELRLLRSLLVSAPPAIPHQTSLPTYTKLLAPPNPHLIVAPHAIPRPLPCHATYLPVPTHSPLPTITRTPKASTFPCYLLQPLPSSPAILLLHSLEAFIGPALKLAYLSTASLGEPRGKPVQTYLFN